jgi:hypothetical protein
MSNAPNGRYSAQNLHEGVIRAVAEGQGGHITRAQLHQLGLTDDAIKHLIRRGFLLRVYHGVYAVGHLPQLPLDRAHAALLAVGTRSALGLGSAGSYRPKGIIVHRCTSLTRADIHIDPRTRVRVTSAARTALDLTPRLSDKRAARMARDLRIRRVTTLPQLRDVIRRNPRHPGTQRLQKIVLGSQRQPTRSDLEDAFMAIVTAFNLPVPEINEHVNGERVDFLYREHRLIVEVDGYDAHSDPVQFAEDRRRDREILIATGISTIRFTYDDCLDTPAEVAASVRAALARHA